MTQYPEAEKIKTIIDDAQRIVIVQADNPDADSLGSALALEQILDDLGKEPLLYCAVDMPGYLRYLSGWDRVESDLPASFEASVIVDASTMTLLEKLDQHGQQQRLAKQPCIVLDHHGTVDNVVPFANVLLNDASRSSTGELIYALTQQLQWPLAKTAQEYIMTAILGDTQGLTNQLASAQSYRIMADLVSAGVDRPHLEELRREYGKMPLEIFRYKASLMARTEFTHDTMVASVTVPQAEITRYSPLYNPGPLVQGDMLQTTGVRVSIVFKHYSDGKVTAAIRCNAGVPIAAKIAEHFGGGGHDYASGFKITDGRPFQEIKRACLDYAAELLATL